MRTLFLAGAAGLAMAAGGPAEARDFAVFDQEVRRQCAMGTFAGVVHVRVKGAVAYEHVCGYADPLNGIAHARDTHFRIFSISKMLTALAIMRLSEEGLIDLDRPITDYISQAPRGWRHASIRSLLNHTSNVPDLLIRHGYHFRGDLDEAMLATLAEQSGTAELAPPDGTFAYSNFGYELLATAGSRVTKKPFAEVLQTRVFDPGGMKTARVEEPEAAEGVGHPTSFIRYPNLALGFVGSPQDLREARPWSYLQLGAGAVHATVDDFVALDKALSEGRIIRPETYDAMKATSAFGLGLQILRREGMTLHGHTGGNNGYQAEFWRKEDDGAVLVTLSNRGFTKGTLTGAFARTIAAGRTRPE